MDLRGEPAGLAGASERAEVGSMRSRLRFRAGVARRTRTRLSDASSPRHRYSVYSTTTTTQVRRSRARVYAIDDNLARV